MHLAEPASQIRHMLDHMSRYDKIQWGSISNQFNEWLIAPHEVNVLNAINMSMITRVLLLKLLSRTVVDVIYFSLIAPNYRPTERANFNPSLAI
jgi:hypothetical protein